MLTGERDRLISIERAERSKDSTSGEVTLADPVPIDALVWANVRQPSGSEVFRAQQLVAKVDAIFNIRWRDDVSAIETLSIVYQGRRYDITAVLEPLNSPRRSELDLYAFARAE